MAVKSFKIFAAESRGFIRRARFAGGFPPKLPPFCQVGIFIRIVFQLLVLPIRLIPAANSKPEVVSGYEGVDWKVFEGWALAKHNAVAAFRIEEASQIFASVLHKIAYSVVTHAGVSRHCQGKQYSRNYGGFHDLSLVSDTTKRSVKLMLNHRAGFRASWAASVLVWRRVSSCPSPYHGGKSRKATPVIGRSDKGR